MAAVDTQSGIARLAAAFARADVIVRVTSDCPALDPYLLDRMLATWNDDNDYLSNFHPQRTFPRGLDLEVVRRTALDRAAAEASDPYEREHVTPYIYSGAPQLFRRRGFLRAGEDLSGWRWTLDTAVDAAFFDELVSCFGVERYATEPAHEPLAAFLRERPEIAAINAHVAART